MTINELILSGIAQIKNEAHKLISPTDWYIIRQVETGIPVPAAITTYRNAVRSITEQRIALISVVTTEDEYYTQLTKQATVPGLEPGTTIPVEGGNPDWPELPDQTAYYY